MKNRNELEDVIKKFARFEVLEAVVMTSRVFWDVNAVSFGWFRFRRRYAHPKRRLSIYQSTRSDIPEGLSLCCKTYRREYQIFTKFILLFTSNRKMLSETGRNFIVAPFVSQCCVCR